ncbi:hypothetical protein KL921_002155 [Ogataea angusta]|uniref:Signal recognition particle receptor subunit beta n=1 Tax=Pichia angusta TaxID=870730 RepID=A0AAN6DI49_PICAN|nr:uncharacterized protein KL928_002336 [Ogataea angusta]KAG7811889.1 hypothetical protein KL921_002155 [Ogataea angusta]KAG7819662.1 hypothetical protein KL928_002336 [Ogataea angusta]KAG7824444.1 hypothetical protein KL909_002442 [Ogataea angusta]KAG7830767.1 hypothetical protein KL920_001358 [Ogataea angusta]KAG7840592.1 hypothetical protein KL942_002543 [Ogataea angusta]
MFEVAPPDYQKFIVSLLLALAVLVVTSVLFNRKRIFHSSKPVFVISGPKSSGKTNLFELLTKGDLPVLTVSSVEPNSATLNLGAKIGSYDVYDFPGNEKLKSLYLYPFLKEKLSSVKGIIYMIDASQFSSEYCTEVAQDLIRLYEITESVPNGVDFQLFCNKCDLFTSKKWTTIKSLLESEIAQICKRQILNLSQISAKDGQSDEAIAQQLASSFRDGKFQFELLEGNTEFGQGNVHKKKIEMVTNWLHEKAIN